MDDPKNFFDFATFEVMQDFYKRLMIESSNIQVEDIDYLLLHQGNIGRILIDGKKIGAARKNFTARNMME